MKTKMIIDKELRETFTPKEINLIYGIPLSTIYDLVYNKQIQDAFKIGTRWYIPKSSLLKFISANMLLHKHQ